MTGPPAIIAAALPPVVDNAAIAAIAIVALAMLLTTARLFRGPTLADRVVALDLLGSLVIGFAALVVLRSGHADTLWMALTLALLLFLGTVAFARYMEGLPPDDHA